MNRIMLLILALAAVTANQSATAAEAATPIAITEIKRDAPVDFAKEIAPILKQKCAACHNATEAESDFSVETVAAMLKGGSGGPGIVAGKGNESLLLLRASGKEEPQMPPADNKANAKPLTPDELGLIKLWIDHGAKAPEVETRAAVEWQSLPNAVSPIYAVALSRDGQYAACGRGNRISIYHIPTARLVETLADPALAASDTEKANAPSTRDLVQSLAFSPDGYTLAAGEFRTVKLWTRAKNARFVALEASGAADAHVVATSADGRWLASSGVDTAIQLWDLTTGKLARVLKGHTGAVTALGFDSKGERLFSTSEDRTLRAWKVADGVLTGRIEAPQPLTALTLLDDARLVTADAGYSLRVWTAPTALPTDLAAGSAGATVIATSPTQNLAAIGQEDGAVRVLDGNTSALKHTLAAHQGAVTGVALQSQGTKLATIGADTLLKVWNTADGARLKTLSPGGAAQSAVAVSADGATAVTSGADGFLRVWNLNANGARVLGEANEAAATAFAISPDGKWIATGGTSDGAPAIILRDAATGAIARTFVGHQDSVTAVAFNAACDKILSGSEDKTARLWNVADGAQLASFASHSVRVTAVAFNAAGTQVVSGAHDGSLKVWNAADAAEVRSLAGHTGALIGVAFGPNDEQIVTAADDQTARVWNTADGASLRVISPGVAHTAMAVSRDGMQLSLAGADKQTRVYTVSDGALAATLKGSPEKAASLSFSADGKRLVAAGGGQPSVVWYLPSAAIAETLVTTGGGALAGYVGDSRDVCVATDAKTIVRHAQGCERLIASRPANAIAFGSDNALFYASSADGAVRAITINGETKFTVQNPGGLNALTISPDGKTFATGGDDSIARIWNAENGAAVRTVNGFGAKLRSLAFSPDGKQLVAGGENQAALFDATTGTILQRFTESCGSLAFASGQDFFALAVKDKKARRLSAAAGTRIAAHEQPITAVAAISGAANEVLSAGLDGSIRRWNLLDGKLLKTTSHGAPVVAIAIRPDGKVIASCGADRWTKIWNIDKGDLIVSLRGDVRREREVKSAERTVALATDHAQFLVASVKESEARSAAEKAALDKSVAALAAAEKAIAEKMAAAQKAAEEKAAAEKLSAETAAATKAAEEVKTAAVKLLADATATMNAAAAAKAAADQAAAEAQTKLAAAQKMAEDANKLAAEKAAAAKAAADVLPVKVKAATDAEAARVAADAAKTAAARAKESATTATAKADESLVAMKKTADAAQENVKQVAAKVEPAKAASAKAEAPILAAAFSPDGRTLAVAGADKRVHTYDGATGAPREVFEGHTSAVFSLAFAGARSVISGGGDSEPIAWDTDAPWILARTIGKPDGAEFLDRVTSLAFNPDGNLLATGGGEPSRRGELKLWNVADGVLAREFKDAHSDVIFGVDFSVDGKMLTSGGADKFVKVHSVESGAFVRSFEGHTSHVLGVSWRSNGRAIASAGADNTVKVWNVVTGDQATTIPGFPKEVTSVGFIGDTPNVVTSAGDANIRMHNSENAAGIRTLSGAKDFIYASAVSFDGKLVIAGGQDGVLRAWDGESGKLLHSFEPAALKK